MTQLPSIFSPCRKYRYTLWREWWRDALPRPLCRDCADVNGVCPRDGTRCDPSDYVQFIGLNPSTADETNDDPTIRRCINFAKAWGFGAMCMTNLFAFRATDPRCMMGCSRPIGADNDLWLTAMARNAALIVAGWGNKGAFLGRDKEVLKLLDNVHCLRHTKAGHPEHPLYIPAETQPIPFQ